jgi:hypothetical protein
MSMIYQARFGDARKRRNRGNQGFWKVGFGGTLARMYWGEANGPGM